MKMTNLCCNLINLVRILITALICSIIQTEESAPLTKYQQTLVVFRLRFAACGWLELEPNLSLRGGSETLNQTNNIFSSSLNESQKRSLADANIESGDSPAEKKVRTSPWSTGISNETATNNDKSDANPDKNAPNQSGRFVVSATKSNSSRPNEPKGQGVKESQQQSPLPSHDKRKHFTGVGLEDLKPPRTRVELMSEPTGSRPASAQDIRETVASVRRGQTEISTSGNAEGIGRGGDSAGGRTSSTQHGQGPATTSVGSAKMGPSSGTTSVAQVRNYRHPTESGKRNMIREKLAGAMEPYTQDGDAYSPLSAAIAIEHSMFRYFGKDEENVRYTSKARSILFNLRDPKNPDLRRRVLAGALQPERLTLMDSPEMASDALKRERRLYSSLALQASMYGSLDEQYAATDLFHCRKCHQRKCTYFQLQTRSADEPMTTFVHCLNCNNRWKE
mmetsp:Transcript_64215/g.171904  ORF Transcript_64215/g.171904 Transcript_64215/m.171904 type:complete len:449 (+) Transcript_64215:144-1490(+)